VILLDVIELEGEWIEFFLEMLEGLFVIGVRVLRFLISFGVTLVGVDFFLTTS
jgi:hypothetical protein